MTTPTPTHRQPQANKETQKLQRASTEKSHKEKDRRGVNTDLTIKTEANIEEGTVDREADVIAATMKEARAEMAKHPSLETRGEMNVAMETDPSL